MTAADIREAPATPRQLGAVMREFHRLDLARPAWRNCRLDIAAVLAGRDSLATTRDLASGEAGKLARVLGECRDTRDLAVRVAWAAQERTPAVNADDDFRRALAADAGAPYVPGLAGMKERDLSARVRELVEARGLRGFCSYDFRHRVGQGWCDWVCWGRPARCSVS